MQRGEYMKTDVRETRSGYDVVVCGGGTAGVVAALSAARNGAKTLMIEKSGFLGGTASMGGPFMSFYGPEGVPIVGGIPQEIASRLIARGASPGHVRIPRWNSFTPFNPEELKNLALEMVEEEGVHLLLHAFIVEARRIGSRVECVTVETISGRFDITGKVFIDCTGDAIVAYKAGLPTEKAPHLQAGSQMTLLGGFNKERFVDYVRTHPGEARGFDEGWSLELLESQEYIAFCGLFSFLKEANRSWHLDMPRDFICFNTAYRPDAVLVVASRASNFDATSVDELTRAETEVRRQDARLVPLLKKHIPGFEDVYFLSTGHQVGVRETRRLMGAYTLTEQDVRQARSFEDTVALGGYPIDVHDPSGKGTRFEILASTYEVPFRCLYTREAHNFLMAGRHISVSHVVHGTTRVMPVCMAVGEAAGAAAAISAKERRPVERISSSKLRGLLRSLGAIVDRPVAAG
jgi:hypothetical protein